jgi:hypothetical protein
MVPLDLCNGSSHTSGMDILTFLGIAAIVLGILALIGAVPGGIVAAIVLLIVGLVLVGAVYGPGRRSRL